ncbi:MAG: 30S ribosomal protein S17 [Patescibacteria group bacterium]
MTGKVVSNKMTKAVVVEVVTPKMNTKYKKAVKSKKRYPAACLDSSIFAIGQSVEIISCRPVSKTIHFKVKED